MSCSHAVDYGDGSDEAFLRRLWHDLYGDQPGAGAGPHRALDAASCEDLAGRLYGLLIGLEDRLDREDARQLHHFIEVGEYGLALEEIAGAFAHAKAPITDKERSDMLTLARTMNMDDPVPRAVGSARVPGSRTDIRMVSSGGPLRNGTRPWLGCRHDWCGYHGGRGTVPGVASASSSGDSGTPESSCGVGYHLAGGSGRDASRCRVGRRAAGAGAGVPAVAGTGAARRGR